MKKTTQHLVLGLLAMLPMAVMADNVITAMTWNETDQCYYPTYSESGEVKTTKFQKTSWYDLAALGIPSGVTDVSGNGTTLTPNGFTGDKVIRYQFTGNSSANTSSVYKLGFRQNTYYFPGYGMHANGTSSKLSFSDFVTGQVLELTWIQGNSSNTATLGSYDASGADYSTENNIAMVDRSANKLARMFNIYTPEDKIIKQIGTSIASNNGVNLYCSDAATTAGVLAPYSISFLKASCAASELDYRVLVTNDCKVSYNITTDLLNSIVPADKRNRVFFRVANSSDLIGTLTGVSTSTSSSYGSNIINYAMYDGFDYTVPSSITVPQITYDRTFTADIPQTVCLPFALTAEEVTAAGKFYALSSMSGSAITFAEQSTTTANYAYIFVPKITGKLAVSGSKTLSVYSNTNNLYDDKITYSGNSLVLAGVHVEQKVYPLTGSHADYNLYVFTTTGELKRVSTSNGITLKPFRGYLRVRTNQYNPDAAGARPLTFALGDDGNEASGISAVSGMEEIFRSQLYDLQGRKVTAPTKGLYIVNGKKVMIK